MLSRNQVQDMIIRARVPDTLRGLALLGVNVMSDRQFAEAQEFATRMISRIKAGQIEDVRRSLTAAGAPSELIAMLEEGDDGLADPDLDG